MIPRRTAVYTTVYPGVEPFLPRWWRSLCAQTDRDFDLWIGLDSLSPDSARAALGGDPGATWLEGRRGDTPARIRSRAIERMVDRYEMIIFVDSDDILHPTRVAAARRDLRRADAVACAMRIVGLDGRDRGGDFRLPPGSRLAGSFPRSNVFGMSNSAYRARALRPALPIPAGCRLVDWYLAARAWAAGARMLFDPVCRMDYRRDPKSVAPLLPPFSGRQVAAAADLVVGHYAFVFAGMRAALPRRREILEKARSAAAAFREAIFHSPSTLARYIAALNRLARRHLWWDIVAHPLLEGIWKN